MFTLKLINIGADAAYICAFMWEEGKARDSAYFIHTQKYGLFNSLENFSVKLINITFLNFDRNTLTKMFILSFLCTCGNDTK